jgi:hypothetical protein
VHREIAERSVEVKEPFKVSQSINLRRESIFKNADRSHECRLHSRREGSKGHDLWNLENLPKKKGGTHAHRGAIATVRFNAEDR